jgi:hypothetical protein
MRIDVDDRLHTASPAVLAQVIALRIGFLPTIPPIGPQRDA